MEAKVSKAAIYREQTQRNDLKQHADKIIQGIKKIGPNHAKRAIWELFQNAVDLSPSCEIEIELREEELVFSHNGEPFTMHTLDCLFTQVSSKTLTEKKEEREEGDPIGQYGTGFMTSHSFGDIVEVSAAIQDETEEGSGHIKFSNLKIDRSTQDWEKLCDEIKNLRAQVEELLKKEPAFDELPKTVFKFSFNNELNKTRALDATKSLNVILPYVMVFNDRLKKVTVTDNEGVTTTYLNKEAEIDNGDFYTRVIQINDKERRINYLKTDRLAIVLPIESNSPADGSIGEAVNLQDTLPRLFLFYPLIGTEHLGINYIIHSKNFHPTEPRDGLHLNSQNEKNEAEELINQKLMKEAFDSINSFLNRNLSKIQNPHLLSQVNFPVNSDNEELNEYFKKIKEEWTYSFKTLPLVETPTGRLSTQDVSFLKNNIIHEVDEPTLEAIYNVVSVLYEKIPKLDLIRSWTKLVDDWDIQGTEWIEFNDIAERLSEKGKIESFKKEDLILLYNEMIRKGKGELFANNKLLPNIKGQFRKQIELKKTIELPEELFDIANAINPEITNSQINPDFLLEGLEFSDFDRKKYMEFINASLDEHIKDNTRSKDLPEGYLKYLIQYARIIPREDSTSGPVQVTKLIEEYYDLASEPIILPNISKEEGNNLDTRKGQNDLFRVFLNDISNKDCKWTEEHLTELVTILKEAFKYAEIKRIFWEYQIFPNQLYQLKKISNLKRDDKIPESVKDLYDKIVEPENPIRNELAHSLIASIENIHNDLDTIEALDLTSKIEKRFFGESGNEIDMKDNPFKSDIIDIIRSFNSEQENNEKLYPATSRNKSAILAQLADQEASFTILSQTDTVIKKLAEIAGHSDPCELIRLAEEAWQTQQQEKLDLQFKMQIGNHLEDVLQKRLKEHLKANVVNEQDGQDLVVYVNGNPVYYIEVKSKWKEETPIRISRNQTLKAHEKRACFALCTKYKGEDRLKIENIESVAEYMKFNTDIGDHVEHLVEIYDSAHQENEFCLDGDFRTRIPMNYIKGGIDLERFEKRLLENINNNIHVQ